MGNDKGIYLDGTEMLSGENFDLYKRRKDTGNHKYAGKYRKIYFLFLNFFKR